MACDCLIGESLVSMCGGYAAIYLIYISCYVDDVTAVQSVSMQYCCTEGGNAIAVLSVSIIVIRSI